VGYWKYRDLNKVEIRLFSTRHLGGKSQSIKLPLCHQRNGADDGDLSKYLSSETKTELYSFRVNAGGHFDATDPASAQCR